MPTRDATSKDLPAITNILAAAFHDENLNAMLLPYRNDYPSHYLRAWRHKMREDWWNYQKKFEVIYEVDDSGKQDVKGVAVWTRNGEGWEGLWGIKGRWDPRLLVRKVLIRLHSIHRMIFPNRASIRPTPENPNPLTWWTWLPAVIPFAAKFFVPPTAFATTGTADKSTIQLYSSEKSSPAQPSSTSTTSTQDPTTNVKIKMETQLPDPTPHPVPADPSPSASPPSAPFWELSILGVHPTQHNKSYGRTLTNLGLARARQDRLPAVVVAAQQKEKFYQRCGFVDLVGYATEGEGNPMAGIPGGAVLWTKYPE